MHDYDYKKCCIKYIMFFAFCIIILQLIIIIFHLGKWTVEIDAERLSDSKELMFLLNMVIIFFIIIVKMLLTVMMYKSVQKNDHESRQDSVQSYNDSRQRFPIYFQRL